MEGTLIKKSKNKEPYLILSDSDCCGHDRKYVIHMAKPKSN